MVQHNDVIFLFWKSSSWKQDSHSCDLIHTSHDRLKPPWRKMSSLAYRFALTLYRAFHTKQWINHTCNVEWDVTFGNVQEGSASRVVRFWHWNLEAGKARQLLLGSQKDWGCISCNHQGFPPARVSFRRTLSSLQSKTFTRFLVHPSPLCKTKWFQKLPKALMAGITDGSVATSSKRIVSWTKATLIPVCSDTRATVSSFICPFAAHPPFLCAKPSSPKDTNIW